MTKTALITGASGGIGYEFAKIAASNHINLVLIARSEDKLNEIKKELESKYSVSVCIIPKDLSMENSVNEIYQELLAKSISIDYLVNNAGFGGFGKFSDRDINKDLNMIDLNIKALVKLTHLILPQMIERKSGKVLNVASTAGFMPGPNMATYFATKAFVVSFSQAIAKELDNTGVSVTALCPGPVDTGFISAGDLEGSNLFKNSDSPETIAQIGFDAMMNNELVTITRFKFLLNWIVPFIPRKILLSITKQMINK